MFTEHYFIDGLACASYLVGCETNAVAAVIDPDRDVRKYLQTAKEHGLTITHIIETHLHADHVSGNTELAERTGADIYLHESSGVEFNHRPLKHEDVLELGSVRLRAIHTPGHTPESMTLLVADTTRADEPWLALTGDTLFVGDIGRPDLVSIEAARGLAEDMYDTLFEKLLALPDSLMIYPGHGAGSLCGKSIGAMRSTTLGYERKYNTALAPRQRHDFIEFATTELPEQPGNHKRIKSINRKGPKPLGAVQQHPLHIEEARWHFQNGAGLLDTRSTPDFVRAHIPGAVHIQADSQLSGRVGFVLPPDIPVIVLLNDPSQYESLVYSLARVGYDSVIGYLSERLDAWEKMGLPLASGDIKDIEPRQLYQMLQEAGNLPVVVDVREPWEYQRGHVPGARLIPLGQLSARWNELDPRQPVAVICATGSRSQSAAALLSQQGFETIYNVLGGTKAWMHGGLDVQRGE